MKRIEKVIEAIKGNKEIMKRLNKEAYCTPELLASDMQTYVKALKDGRVRYSVMSVSRSGMSRQIEIISCEKSDYGYWFRQYGRMLEMLGYRVNRDNLVVVNGCGMSMTFHVNYSLIHTFCRLGLISKAVCSKLSQKIN